jgi:hypothetical protein
MKLLIEIFNWDVLFTHIMEFVCLDENFRLKLLGLDKITTESTGWTYLGGQQVSEHKRILINMRCFLHYHARIIWGNDVIMFSEDEYEKIKSHEDNHYSCFETLPGFDLVSNGDQFWFLMQAIDDKEATNNFFKFMVEKFYKLEDGTHVSGIHKTNIVQNVIEKCTFTLE